LFKLESTIKSKDIYDKVRGFLDKKNIPFNNIISCAADEALNMMGKKVVVFSL
jgi:hypothetical protein